MNTINDPCRGCFQRVCPQEGCQQWQQWFLQRWENIHQGAWQAVDLMWRRRRDAITWELPHLVRCPCADCPCEHWCQRPCAGKRMWDRCCHETR